MLKQTSIALAAALLIALPCLAQTQTPPPAQTPPPTQADANSRIEKAMMPEAPPVELKRLSLLKGSWTSNMHMFASPMGPESDSKSKASFDWVFNGMHLEGNHQFQAGGKPSKGRSTWGWDPEKKQYQIVWVDTMYPSGFVYYGTFANDNTLVCFTTYMMRGKAVTEKMSYVFSDADHYTMTMESDMSGEMKPIMEQKGTRVKSPATASKSAPKKTTTTTTTTKKSG